MNLLAFLRLLTVLLLAWLPASGLASPGPAELPARIAEAAVAALDLGQGGQATLDPNLRLARCQQPLATRVAAAATVEVSCAQPAWRLFVPVVASNRQAVLVLARAVAAGQPLVAADLASDERQTAGAAQALLVDPAQAIGRVARRHLQAGSVLSHADLQAQPLVHRGQTVDLLTRRGNVEVRVSARALRDGALGQQVAVRNLSTGKNVQGTVQADGSVMVR